VVKWYDARRDVWEFDRPTSPQTFTFGKLEKFFEQDIKAQFLKKVDLRFDKTVPLSHFSERQIYDKFRI
jgi:hypothetical protein